MTGVSFIIPNYNGEKYIDSCLKSIYNQSFKEIKGLEFAEVIIADNASTDDSVVNAQAKYKNVKVLINRCNMGVANAINRGIEAAKGEFVAVVHVDTVLDKDWLKHSIEVLEDNPSAFAAIGMIVKNDGSGIIDSCGFGFSKSGYAYKIGAGKPIEKSGKCKAVLAPHNAAALYRKSCFGKLGKFDERFFAYLEDADMGIRALLQGFDTVYSPYIMAYHTGFTLSGGEECDFTARFKARNNMYLRYKNMTPLQRFNGKIYLSRGVKRLKKHFGRQGLRTNVEEGIYEAVCTKRNCTREYKNSSFRRRFVFKNKMLKSVFSSKKGL